MDNLQKKEYELLACFIKICEKLNLRYFLVCGSALGAVKYGGFIPWDDDIDVALFRDDYNKFIAEAPDFLPKNLFLQTHGNDPEYMNISAKLRNSDTTFIEKSAAHLKINHGIYIDIFPLDGYPKNEAEQKLLELKKKIYKIRLLENFSGERRFITKAAIKIISAFINCEKALCEYEKLISKYPVEGSKLICNHGNWQGKLEYAPAWQYGKGEEAVFEGLSVTVPEKYDEYLTQKYGDWRADLPESEKVGHHYYEICDTEKPYTYYNQK